MIGATGRIRLIVDAASSGTLTAALAEWFDVVEEVASSVWSQDFLRFVPSLWLPAGAAHAWHCWDACRDARPASYLPRVWKTDFG